jgi:hypothetical protein
MVRLVGFACRIEDGFGRFVQGTRVCRGSPIFGEWIETLGPNAALSD